MRDSILHVGPILILGAILVAPTVRADEKKTEALHQAIDRFVEARAKGPTSSVCSDEEFVRRLYLDWAGRIPTGAEARAFLKDSPADRVKLIDQLLGSDEYVARMTDLFSVMLMERLGEHEQWREFLSESIRANRPWDQITRAILNPIDQDEKLRGAAFFYTKRLEKYGQNPVDYPGLVRDIGRLFLGVDVQCAQCHDHLFVDQYKQVDYQGLSAFVGSTFIRRDVTFPAVGEKPLTKKIEFKSVFDQQPQTTGPKLPGGKEVAIPALKRGEEYITPPDRKKRTPGVLRFSTLKALAEELPNKDNELFKLNIVNRMWWFMMGRGIVDPLDLHHVDNPPSHPELLKHLADRFAERKFDLRWLLKEMALSKTYQRSSLLPDNATEEPPAKSYRTALERPLSAEQLLDSMLTATEMRKVIGSRKAVAAESEKKTPAETKAKKSDEVRARFLAAWANTPREPEVSISPTVKAALFLLNDQELQSWFRPQAGNLVDRLTKIKDDGKAIEELYLCVLTRRPSEGELKGFHDYLKKHAEDRADALGRLAWALATSTEFCVNH